MCVCVCVCVKAYRGWGAEGRRRGQGVKWMGEGGRCRGDTRREWWGGGGGGAHGVTEADGGYVLTPYSRLGWVGDWHGRGEGGLCLSNGKYFC